MCAVAKCKSKKFSLFSTFAVAFSCSFFVAFLSLKTTIKFFDMTNYFPQKRTLWPGQSLSSPIRRRFFWPQMKRFVDTNNFQHIFVRVHAIAAKTWVCFSTLLDLEVSWNWRFHEISMRYPTLPQEGAFIVLRYNAVVQWESRATLPELLCGSEWTLFLQFSFTDSPAS